MFKPVLKRYQPLYPPARSNRTLPCFSPKQIENQDRHNLRYPPPVIVPHSLFVNKVSQQSNPTFNPLNYSSHKYPQSVLQMLNTEPQQQLTARDVGCHDDILWCFNGLEVILWKQQTNIEKKYQLPHRSQIIAFGELQSSALHFKSSNPIIMVVGIQNYIHLFGINRQTLEYDDFKVCYKVVNSSFIQKVVFNQKNQIIVVSDTGHHISFDFREELRISGPQVGFLQKNMPYIPLLYPKRHLFYENTVVLGNYICSLVREEKKTNWFSYKAKKVLSQMLNSERNEEWITQNRKIQIYKLNRQKKCVTLVHTIPEWQIVKKLRKNYNPSQHNSSSQIIGINLKRNTQTIVEIALKSGHFISLDLSDQVTIDNTFLKIPNHNAINMTGFFLQKKINVSDEHDTSCPVISSLGTDNLTQTQNSLLFFNETSIEVIKLGGHYGTIVELKSKPLENRKWVFFTQNCYFVLSRITPREILTGFIYQREQIRIPNNISKRYTHESNFQLLVENVCSSIGYEKMIQSLAEGYILQQDKIFLANEILEYIKNDLEGIPNVNIRDWSYELTMGKGKPIKKTVIDITTKINSELWNLMISYSNKGAKNQPLNLPAQKQIVSAYWLAIKDIFHNISQPLLSIQPKNIKVSRNKINFAQKELEKLCQLFNEKKKREQHLANQLYLSRKQVNYEKQDINSFFKRKKYQEVSRQKLEESMDTQHTENAESKLVTESSLSLEKDIFESLDKIKAVVEIIMYLSEVRQSQKMPSLEQIFLSKDAQIIVKDKLIQQTENRKKLEQFDKVLPQLQLRKDLELLSWIENHQKFKKHRLFDLQLIASWLSTLYLKKILPIFEDQKKQQVQLLMNFWSITSAKLKHSIKLYDLQTSSPNLYSKDSKILLNQTSNYLKRQLKIIKENLYEIITQSIRNYIERTEYQSPNDAEDILDFVIGLVLEHNDMELNGFVEEELKKAKINEKILFFRKHLKPKVVEISTQDRLVQKKVLGKQQKDPFFFALDFPQSE